MPKHPSPQSRSYAMTPRVIPAGFTMRSTTCGWVVWRCVRLGTKAKAPRFWPPGAPADDLRSAPFASPRSHFPATRTHRYFVTPYGGKVARLFSRLGARGFRPAVAMFTGNDAVLPFPVRASLGSRGRAIRRLVGRPVHLRGHGSGANVIPNTFPSEVPAYTVPGVWGSIARVVTRELSARSSPQPNLSRHLCS